MAKFLHLDSKDRTRPGRIPCVTLSHNEANILPAFLRHYRNLGSFDFLIVDDNSTDSSASFLRSQPDVTLFRPTDRSRYSLHKMYWRRELLNAYAPHKWCLVPDIDEHFVFPNMEHTSLSAFISALQLEGADASLTVMIDMYGDMPLSDHVFASGDLLDRFPFFDAPGPASQSYRLIAPPRQFRQKFPCPVVAVFGGMRERVFVRNQLPLSRWHSSLVDEFADINGPLQPSPITLAAHDIIRWMTRVSFDNHELITSKLGLLKWRPGLQFSGGAHAVNVPLNLSSRRCAFLHFPITRGLDGIRYIANRGQHWRGSHYYKRILSAELLVTKSPVYKASRRYVSSGSLGSILK